MKHRLSHVSPITPAEVFSLHRLSPEIIGLVNDQIRENWSHGNAVVRIIDLISGIADLTDIPRQDVIDDKTIGKIVDAYSKSGWTITTYCGSYSDWMDYSSDVALTFEPSGKLD